MRPFDKMLCPERLHCIARLWAYDLPYEDVRLSPTYGEYAEKQVWLFVGSKELFYPSARRFAQRNAEKGNAVHIVEGAGLQHVYPLMPTPEGAAARRQICEIISEAVYKR